MNHAKYLIFTLLLLGMFTSGSKVHADTSFAKFTIGNPNSSTTFYVRTDSANYKTNTNAAWYYTLNELTFTRPTTGTWGMAFTPMKKVTSGSSYYYSLVGAEVRWTTTTISYDYGSWNGNGTNNRYYYIAARLDTCFPTDALGSAQGYWNAY